MVKLEDYEALPEAARRLGVSRSLAARWCREGKLPCEKMGFYWLVERDSKPSVQRRKTQRKPRLKLEEES